MTLPERLRRLFRKGDGSDPLGNFVRDLSVAFVGHFLSKGLGIVTFYVVVNALTKGEYGLYMLAWSVYEIALYISELGFDIGINRFVSKGIRGRDTVRTERVLKIAFMVKIALGLLVLAIGLVSAPFIATAILKRPEATGYLRLAFTGVVGMHLQKFYLAYFGARLEFERSAVFSALAPFCIFLGVLAGKWAGILSVTTVLAVYALTPLVVCGFAIVLLPHGFLRQKNLGLEPLLELWRFSRWTYGTNVLGTVRFRLNSILLSRLATIEAVGLYNFGDKLASTLTLFTETILTVFIPRASHLVTRDEVQRFLRGSYRWLLILTPALALLPLGSRPVIGLVFPDYIEATSIFNVLFVSILFSLAAMPSRTVLYSIHRPELETAVEAVALVLTFVSGYTLIQTHGGYGAAYAMLLQRAVSAGLTVGLVHYLVFVSAAPLDLTHAD